MKTEKIYLYEGRDDVFLTTYIAESLGAVPAFMVGRAAGAAGRAAGAAGFGALAWG